MSASAQDYIPVLIQIAIGILLPVIILVASHIFGQRSRTNFFKDSPYECGIPTNAKPHPRFAVKFYVTAMLFILFDIEIVFLVPWALIYREFLAGAIPIVAPTAVFIGVIVLGLIYEIRKGALKWER